MSIAEDRVAAVAESLGMDPVPESEELLRKRIRAELRDLHPDKNEGDFESGEARERFTQLSNALVRLDSDAGSTALVPLSTVAPMVSAIVEALGQVGREASPLEQRQAILSEAREEARHRFRLSRLGSGSVALVVSALWMIPTLATVFGSDNVTSALQASIVAPLFAHPLFEPIAFGVALYAWLFFGLTWFMEQNDLSRIDWITTDEARGVLLTKAILMARQRGDTDSVTKADLRNALGRGLRPAFILRFLGARDVSASFLDRVVGQHLAVLTAQGVLTPAPEAGLSPRYTVAESVAKDVKP